MKDHNCIVCPIAKQTRLPFPTSVSLSNACFEIVQVYVWGPYRDMMGKGFFNTGR